MVLQLSYTVAGVAVAAGFGFGVSQASWGPQDEGKPTQVLVVNQEPAPVPVTSAVPLPIRAGAPLPIITSAPIDANVTGTVNANVTGLVSANVFGNVNANVSGLVDANVSGTVDANVTGIVMTKDTEHPARNPVRVSNEFVASSTFASVGGEIYRVPAGKRLVVEHIGLRAISLPAFGTGIEAVAEVIIRTVDNTMAIVEMPFAVRARDISVFRQWDAGEPITMYADEGEYVRVVVQYSQTVTAAAAPRITMVGYLVDRM